VTGQAAVSNPLPYIAPFSEIGRAGPETKEERRRPTPQWVRTTVACCPASRGKQDGRHDQKQARGRMCRFQFAKATLACE
jgi:hypothetical protein